MNSPHDRARARGAASSRGRLLRLDDVIATTGLSRSAIYRLIAAGDFPATIRLTARAVGWWENDVAEWVDRRRQQAA